MAEHRKKLIEVALPLEAINRESQHEKSVPRRGHPATMHLWWARRPLAACRAVLFASIVDDPSSRPDAFPTEEEQDVERQRLFRIIEELIRWENSQNTDTLSAARAEIDKATVANYPRFSIRSAEVDRSRSKPRDLDSPPMRVTSIRLQFSSPRHCSRCPQTSLIFRPSTRSRGSNLRTPAHGPVQRD
jgi:hypothetical protein